MKGFVTLYLNLPFDRLNETTVNNYINMVRQQNKGLIEKLDGEGYDFMIVPVQDEAARMEKVDFDKPYPRMVGGIDVLEHETLMDEMREEIRKKMLEEENG